MKTILSIIIAVVLFVGFYMFFAKSVTTDKPLEVPGPLLTGATGRPPEGGGAGLKSWAMFRGGQRLLGTTPAVLTDSLTFLWKFKTGAAVKSSPAILRDKVFVGSGDGNVYAIDLNSGREIWKYKTEGPIEAAACVIDGAVFVGSSDTFFYAIDSSDGSELWKYETGGKILGGANWFLTKDKKLWILVGSYDSKLYCFDSGNGRVVWQYQTDSFVNGTPAIANARAVFGGCDSMIHVVSVTDGKSVRMIDGGTYIAASPALYEDEAYIGNYDNVFMCADISQNNDPNKSILWEYSDRDEPFFSSAAVSDEFVIVGSRDKRLHCLNRRDGSVAWTFQTQGEVDSSPVICSDKVIVGSEDGRLYMINLSDGKELWSYEIGSSITSSPAVAAGKVVIGSDDGYIYAFGEQR